VPLPAISSSQPKKPPTYQIGGAGNPVSKEEFDRYAAWAFGPGSAPPTYGGFVIPGRAGEVSPEEWRAHWTNTFRADPEMARIAKLDIDERAKNSYAQMRAQELGWTPAMGDWSLDFDKATGGFQPQRANYWDRNADWLIPAIAGGFMGAGAIAGAGGAAGGGGAAAGGGGTAGTGAAAGGTAAATGGGVAGGTAATTAAGGGILPAIAKYAGVAKDVGSNLSALSAGRAEGRAEEAKAANEYDRLNLLRNQTILNRANTELDQRTFAEKLQGSARRNAPRASFLQNAQDVSFDNLPPGVTMPSISGGLRPSAIRDRAAIGKTVYDQSMHELTDPLQPGTATSGRRMAEIPMPDPISPTPEAGPIDTALNWGGIIGGTVLPAISGIYNASQAKSAPPSAADYAAQQAASPVYNAIKENLRPRRQATAQPQDPYYSQGLHF